MTDEKNSDSSKVLPSFVLSMEKQIEILKAFAVYYSKQGKGATYKEISNIADAGAANVSGSLKFWKSIDILNQNGNVYEPTKALVDFNNKIQWDENEAWPILKSALTDQWFVTQTKLKFGLNPEISYEDLVKSLGSVAKVSNDKNTAKALRHVIELLELCKIIEKQENGNYHLADAQNEPKKMIVDETKDLIQVKIGSKTFAIDTDKIRSFVETNGKEIGTDGNRL